ncbi:integrase arm-type DNA-binding domain-containing protein [Ruegeria sp. HKCCSP351]|uniref:tyrosine-type recombinase/integrase n=1 Tax=Ruegeria sp. HKCCSP351 TaxID=2794832 RepID=UPI001AE8C793|nr:integrase arm-type DNA-binding domain-containing protein [Ruegeria sp. HKCCSP351]
MAIKLSARNLAEAQAGKLFWDTEVKGFGARKATNGDVTLFLNYQVRGTGKYKRLTIGKLGELTVDAARKRAAQMRLEIRAGMDPSQQAETVTAKAKHSDTLGQYVSQWVDSPKHSWSDKTRYDYRKSMERHLLDTPEASKRIGEISRADLMRLIDAATDASASGGALFYRVLSSFLTWCDDRELCEVTLPRAKRVAPPVPPRTRVMSDDEIKALWDASKVLTPKTRACGRLMLLTAQRTGAVQRLNADWVTQAGVTWPAEAMKAGRAHFTPLTPWAYDCLRPALADAEGEIFGHNTNRLNLAWRKQWRPKAGVDAGLRMHDVRRSLRTWAAANGYGHEASEAALAHEVQRDALAKAYQQHDYAEEAAEVLRGWQNHVQELVA